MTIRIRTTRVGTFWRGALPAVVGGAGGGAAPAARRSPRTASFVLENDSLKLFGKATDRVHERRALGWSSAEAAARTAAWVDGVAGLLGPQTPVAFDLAELLHAG
jgi:hypothetical protein